VTVPVMDPTPTVNVIPLLDCPPTVSLTSAVESQFSAFWADKFSRFNESLLEVLNSDE